MHLDFIWHQAVYTMAILQTIILLLSSLAFAQRPSTASICDYYAIQQYGGNTSATQLQLVQHIVTLAFAGRGNLTNISSENTGILLPGTYDNTSLNLQNFFNGSIASTNLNNQGVGVDWLNGGGLAPLYDYLEGRTSDVVISNTTNQL